jgi:MFS family permease
MLMLGAHPVLVPLVALAFLSGCGIEVFSIGWQTALHEHIPNDVLSRVSSYDALGSFVVMPLGQLVFGPLSKVIEARALMIVSAIVFVVISLATLGSSSVRNLERGSGQPAETPSPGVAGHR